MCHAEGEKSFCGQCDWVDYDPPMPVVVVLGLAYEDKFNPDPNYSIVLVQRNIEPHKGGWCLPGGYVNTREDPRDAAVREFKEETGLDIVIEKPIHVCNPDPTVHNKVVIFFMGRVSGGEVKTSDETSNVVFRDVDGILPKLCFSSHQDVLDRFVANEWDCEVELDDE